MVKTLLKKNCLVPFLYGLFFQPPPSGFSDAKQIPRTLESALNALESDKVLCDIIGDDLITPFLLSKRAHDLPLKTFEEQFAAYSHVL